jgi:hypothetical protein
LVTGIKLRAQEIHGNPNVWYLLLTHYKINDKWSVGNELHMRFDDWHKDKQQFLERPFVDYSITDGVIATVGYTYILTYPYGEYPLLDNKPEHNIWEQITLKQSVGKFSISHRYRWEHRYQGNLVPNGNGGTTVDGYDYSNRFRYRLTIKRPINDQYFINVFDELWIKSDDRLINSQYDRNWLYAGLGRKVSDHFSFQLAFLHQYAKNTNTRYERHSGLQLTGEFNF